MPATVFVALVVALAAQAAPSPDPDNDRRPPAERRREVSRFTGPGVLTDRGWRSVAPRYEVVLRPAMSLQASRRYDFQFRGMPSETMSLVLRFTRRVSAAEVRSRPARLAVTLAAVGDARPVCQFELAAATGGLTTAGGGATGHASWLWSPACVDVGFSAAKTDDLSVTVSADGEGTADALEVEALIDGGGTDTP